MDSGLWNREKDKIATTTTPGAVPATSARKDLRDMGMSEEARPAADWTDLRQSFDGTRKSARLRWKGKEPVRTSDQSAQNNHSSDATSSSPSTAMPHEYVMFGALRDKSPSNTGDPARSTRQAVSERTVTPKSSEPLLGRSASKDEAGNINEDGTVGDTAMKPEATDAPSAFSTRGNRPSLFARAKKGTAKYLPTKKKKPQY